MLKYNVTIDVPAERVYAMFVGAFEGGSNYWLQEATLKAGTPHTTPGLVWYGKPSVFESDYRIAVKFDDPNDEEGAGKGWLLIKPDTVQAGLHVMSTKYPKHFADMIAENDDADTADCFMQCVVLGDVIYG